MATPPPYILGRTKIKQSSAEIHGPEPVRSPIKAIGPNLIGPIDENFEFLNRFEAEFEKW